MANKTVSISITDDESRFVTIVNYPDGSLLQRIDWYKPSPEIGKVKGFKVEGPWDDRDDALTDIFSTLLEDFDR